MRQTKRSVGVAWLVGLALAFGLAMAATPASAKDPLDRNGERKALLVKKKQGRLFGGRLPRYYKDVVNEETRQKIYAIQQEYQPKISELQSQLEKLREERDAKIQALLTPEQKKKVEELQKEAKAKRKDKAGKDEKAAKNEKTEDEPAEKETAEKK